MEAWYCVESKKKCGEGVMEYCHVRSTQGLENKLVVKEESREAKCKDTWPRAFPS